MTPTKRQLQKIATQMGFRGMKSFADMYKGGTLNAFGHPQNSMTTLTVKLTLDDKVCGIELNTKYFTTTPQIIAFNNVVNYDNPVEVIEAIQIAEVTSKFKNVFLKIN